MIARQVLCHLEILDTITDNFMIGRLGEKKQRKPGRHAGIVGVYMAIDNELFRCPGGKGQILPYAALARSTT
jgi:hypothetical protein